MTNYAFIDGQNLYLGTRSAEKPWTREFASSLYDKLGSEFFDYLENVRRKIE
ncbi:MAG: hypothetical protein WDZ70_00895 [Candidatus Paceibacterota bacterium]